MKEKAGIDEVEYLWELCTTPMRGSLFLQYLTERFEFTPEVLAAAVNTLEKHPSACEVEDVACQLILTDLLVTNSKPNI
jgi:hypothetical protein